MLTVPEAFVKAIQEQPEDDTPRLIYADWLEEQGDPRGEFIRVQCELARTAKGAPGWRRLWERERELFLCHRAAWAGPLAPHLASDQFFQRGLLRREACRQAAFVIVRGLGSAHALSAIEGFAADPHLHEFLACLLHEVVLEEGEVKEPRAVRFAEKLTEMEHPLSRLPLWQLDVEQPPTSLPYPVEEVPRRERRRPSRQTRSRSGEPYILPRRGHDSVRFRDITMPEEVGRIATAVRNWETESNGEWQAAVFRASRPLRPERLSLDLLQSLTADLFEVTWAATVSANEAWTALFGAASEGGAYSPGRRRAWGRLEAWQSFAALLGGDLHEPLQSVARRAQEAVWLEFRADWFNDIAWDVGVMVVRPDRCTVTILAATDVD